jgi:hypothetical protein
MLSKLSRRSNKRHDNLGLGTPHRKIRVAPTHRKKGQNKDGHPPENKAKLQAKNDNQKTNKDTGKW